MNNEDIIMENDIMNEEEETTELDTQMDFDLDLPDDIKEAEDRCKMQPAFLILLGGIAAGAAISAGARALAARIRNHRAKHGGSGQSNRGCPGVDPD